MEVYSDVDLFFIGFLSLLTSKFYLKTEDPLYHTKTYEAVSSNITGTVTIENRVYHPASSSLDMVIKMDQTDEEEDKLLLHKKKRIQTSNYLFNCCMKMMAIMW